MIHRALQSIGLAMLVAGLTFFAAQPVFGQASADPAKFLPAPENYGPVNTGEGYARIAPPSIEALRSDPDIVIVEDVNFPIANTIDGSSINWVTGATCDCDDNPGFDFNAWRNNGNLAFWWWGGSNSRAGLSLNGTTYAVLGEGDTIGPASTFISAGFSAGTVNWRQESNVDGYLGFRFDNAGTVNYGYVRLTTTGTTGFPATIVSYAYNQAGGPITIPFTTPVIEVSPASFEFTLEQGDSDTSALQIANVGGSVLDWDIEFEPSLRGPRSHDPVLDEVLAVPDFTVVSPANGGTPEVFTVPAGILSSGGVVGFSFEGTVSGITGNGDWASDLCLQIEGPDGSSFSVGGIGATIPNCNVNSWDFQGAGSDEDGTYASVHDDVWPFPPGAADQGDWTLTFIHSWDSASANPMDWSNVTVTLHKLPPPEPCDFPAAVSWLSVDSASGSTAGGSADSVAVTVDSAGLAPGDYSANLCINSNDALGNERVVVPVDLTVELTIFPEIEVSPSSLSGTAQEGDSTDLTLSIGNLGTAELIWSIDEAPAAAHPRAHFPAIPWSAGDHFAEGSAEFELLDEEWLAKREREAGVPEWAIWPTRGTADPIPAFSMASFTRFDYVSMDALEPGALNTIINPGPGEVYAQTFIDDDFSQHFFIATASSSLPQGAYGFVDTDTGVINQLGVLSGVPATGTWTSAAWDPTSGAVYAVVRPPGDGNQLFEIDVAAGTGSLVGQITGLSSGAIVIAIAIDGSGLMYGLDVNADVLFALDKTDATAAVIGPLGVNANFAQDMDFDRRTNTLYWASYLGSGNSNMRIIDTSTGATTLIGPIQDGAELLSFSIALPMPPSCVTPAEVPWLMVDADSGSIQPGGPADDVLVTLDASALTEGTYNALLCIASNDPVIPLIEVPVEFVVDPADRIVTASVGTGLGDITPSVQVVPSGDDATFTVTPAFGWSVDSVVGDTCDPVNAGGDQWVAENIIEDCAVEANFVINTYTVTATVGTGEGTITPPSQSVDHGSDATFTVTPETGWSLDSVTGDTCTPVNTGGDQWLAENIIEDCAVQASFLINTYTVTASVASGEGTITPPSQSVDHGSDATFTVTPATGWSLDSVTGDTCTPVNTGGDQWLAENIIEDCAVEASFVINTYTVTATVGAGEGTITPPSQSVDHGSDATFTVTPETGWSLDSVVGDTCTPVNTGGDQWVAENIIEDCAVQASFLINTYTVTASVASGEGTITPPSQSVDHGSDATFTVTPATGWSLDSVTGDTCTPVNIGGDQWLAENIIEDCAVEASFLINTYTVTASVASGEGTITPPSQSVDHGSDATFTVTPTTGWSLDSVTGDTCTPVNTGGDQWLAENIIEDCTVEASFLINTYTVTATVGTGEGTITPPSQSVDHGSDATFTVTPETGWSLDSVTGDTCTPVNTGGDQWLAENIIEDCAVQASFLINTYTVTATIGTGEGTITPPSQSVDHGSDATFTVTPETGWSLDSVTGDTCTPVNTGGDQWLADNIIEDCAVEASFLINTYTLGGTVSGLEGSGLVLSLDDVETLPIAASGAFTFLAELDHGTAWSVSVETQPANPSQTCSIANGSSSGITGDVDNITVTCSTDTFEIGGTIAGLTASGLVLDLNGSESLPLGAGSISFQFADAVADGSDYLVTVETQPDGQWCEVSNGEGTVSGGPVEDVQVSCSDVGIGLSLTDINFGFVILGANETRALTISNPGTNPLIISGISSPGSPFSIVSNSCSPLPRTLNAGESCMVNIEFDGGTLGDFEDEILITSNAQGSPQAVTVRGAIISPLAVPFLSPMALLLLTLMMLVAASVGIRSRQKA